MSLNESYSNDRFTVNHQPGKIKTSKTSNREWFSRVLDILIKNKELSKTLKGARISQFNKNYERDYDGLSRGSSYWTTGNIKAWSDAGINITELQKIIIDDGLGGLSTYVDDSLRRSRWIFRAKHGWNDDSGLQELSEMAVRNAVFRAYDAIAYGAKTDSVGSILLKSDWTLGHYHYSLGDLEALSLGLMNLGHGYFPVTDLHSGYTGLSWAEQSYEAFTSECGWEFEKDIDGSCLVARPSSELGREIIADHSQPRNGAGPVPPCWIGSWSIPDPDERYDGIAYSRTFSMKIHGLSSRKDGYEVKDRPIVEAADRPYWTLPDGKRTFPGVVIDLDRPRAWSIAMKTYREGKIPMWSYAIINHANGHAQFTWLTDPVDKTDNTEMMGYDGIVKSLTRALNADKAFTRHRSQNPCWYGMDSGRDEHEIVFPDGVTRFYSIDGMMKWLNQHHMMDGNDLVRRFHTVRTFRTAEEALADDTACGIDPELLSDVVIPEGRRWEIMFRTATWLASHGESPELAWDKVTLARGSRPFTRREFSKVVTKVKRYRARIAHGAVKRDDSYKKRMSKYGRKGGSLRSEIQVRSTDTNLQYGRLVARSKAKRMSAIVYTANMLRNGEAKSAVASRLGMSRVTYNRHLRNVSSNIRELILRKAFGMMDTTMARDIMSNGRNCESYRNVNDSLSSVMLRINGKCDLESVIMSAAKASIMLMDDDRPIESMVRHGRATVDSGDMDTTARPSRDGPVRSEEEDGW